MGASIRPVIWYMVAYKRPVVKASMKKGKVGIIKRCRKPYSSAVTSTARMPDAELLSPVAISRWIKPQNSVASGMQTKNICLISHINVMEGSFGSNCTTCMSMLRPSRIRQVMHVHGMAIKSMRAHSLDVWISGSSRPSINRGMIGLS